MLSREQLEHLFVSILSGVAVWIRSFQGHVLEPKAGCTVRQGLASPIGFVWGSNLGKELIPSFNLPHCFLGHGFQARAG